MPSNSTKVVGKWSCNIVTLSRVAPSSSTQRYDVTAPNGVMGVTPSKVTRSESENCL